MSGKRANFHVGQLVHHRLFDYRGVVFDVDAEFLGSEEWYEGMARTRPPKDQPWYHVLVHNAVHTTYVAERNLRPDQSDEPIMHPDTEALFAGFEGGRYVPRRTVN